MSPPPGRRHTARMFLRYYVELDLPTPQAQTLLLHAPTTWLPALADQAIQHAEPLLAETGIIVGPPHLHLTRHVTVHLGHPIQFPSKLSLPMTWEPHGWLLPRLDAELELGTLGSHRTQLAINGRYDWAPSAAPSTGSPSTASPKPPSRTSSTASPAPSKPHSPASTARRQCRRASPSHRSPSTWPAQEERGSTMRVSERCHHVLITTEPDDTLVDAAGRMHCYQIGALPVYQQHRLVGIVTERDLVAALAEGADPAVATVADYMTDQPVTVAPDDDLEVAARRMADLGVRHLPVVDGTQLVGVLSIRDLIAGQTIVTTPAP